MLAASFRSLLVMVPLGLEKVTSRLVMRGSNGERYNKGWMVPSGSGTK
jgi:hypothetical protein